MIELYQIYFSIAIWGPANPAMRYARLVQMKKRKDLSLPFRDTNFGKQKYIFTNLKYNTCANLHIIVITY